MIGPEGGLLPVLLLIIIMMMMITIIIIMIILIIIIIIIMLMIMRTLIIANAVTPVRPPRPAPLARPPWTQRRQFINNYSSIPSCTRFKCTRTFWYCGLIFV